MKPTLLLTLLFPFFAVAQSSPFKGNWIAKTTDKTESAAPIFRKTFQVNSPVKKATLYICGLGYHQTTLNGKAITDGVLEQAFTKYDSRLLYSTYDLTKLIQKGKNCLGTELGSGWYNVHIQTIWNFDKIGWRNSPRMIASLIIDYKNGTSDTIGTDESWKTTKGPSWFNSLQSGEVYRMRKEIQGWQNSQFDDSAWQNAIAVASPGGKLEPLNMPQVKVIREIKPKSLKKISPYLWLYDMGENFAGVCRIKVKGKAGGTITLQYSERLDSSGKIDQQHNAGQMIYPKHKAVPYELGPEDMKFQTDRYTLRGEGTESYTPRFTYHGFRYVAALTPKDVKLNLNSITGLFYSTDFKSAGSFNSSSKMLNKLQAAAIQSYRSNYIGIPTDCPQREKMGWLADAHLISELGLYNFDAASSYRKFLGDIRDVQLPDGSLPGVAPTKGIGYYWIDPKDHDFGPAWGSALPLITWNIYLHKADTTVLQENYPAIKKYVNLLASKARKTEYLYTTGLDDFLSIEKTPKAITSTAFLYQDALILSKIAAILSDKKTSESYSKFADSVKTAYNRAFFDFEKGSYKVQTLTALASVLYNDLVPAGFREKAAADLAQGVLKRNYKPDFGVLGTKYVLSALSANGYATEAFKLLTNTKAGWGKWMADGHTTLLEGWEPKDESLNHVFFGDFGAWYYKSLGGIQPDEKHPGFRHFLIDPVFPAGLDWIDVQHQTMFGKISVRWKRKGFGVVLDIEIPQGTNAHLKVKGYEQQLQPGKHRMMIAAHNLK